MRYVNGVLGYVLLLLGFLLAGGGRGEPALGGGAVAVAGAILIAIERYCDLHRSGNRPT